MGILFWHCWRFVGFYIVSEVDVVERKVDGWSVRKVGNDHGVWWKGSEQANVVTKRGDSHLVYRGVRAELSSLLRRWLDKRQRVLLQHSSPGLFGVNLGTQGAFPVRECLSKKHSPMCEWRMSTFANCSSFELGSLDVVMTIFGSWMPAVEYSLSTCVVGSTVHQNKVLTS
jgi:hypothetical protein